MKSRFIVGVTLATLLALTGCGSDDVKPKAGSDRKAVEAYVAALNERDANALLKLDGARGPGVERDAQKAIDEKGGRGLEVEGIRIDYDLGPDTGSALITAKDSKGADYRERLTITRDGKQWHLVILPVSPPHDSSKTPAGTTVPSGAVDASKSASG
ncbi:hypothetical protein ACIRP2_10695 [Streptomyces sp. NPDC101194]|uniref:hypothetical protein n=1 Tax=Streptomyces sp. NPDC101194 TaxID=3366127 RepID=UPI0037FFCD1C